MHQLCAYQPSFKALEHTGDQSWRRFSGFCFLKVHQQENGFPLSNLMFGPLALCSIRVDEPKASGTEQTSTGGFGFREQHWCELHSQLQARSAIDKGLNGWTDAPLLLPKSSSSHDQQQSQQPVTLSTATKIARLLRATCLRLPRCCANADIHAPPKIRERHLSFPSHKSFFVPSLVAARCSLYFEPY